MNAAKTRNLHLAVGIGVVLLLARWLFTGDLLFAVSGGVPQLEADGEPLLSASGEQVKSVGPVVWTMAIETLIVIGAFVTSFATGLWDRLMTLIDGVQTQAEQPASPQNIPMQVMQAIASKDAAELKNLQSQIRLPYAMNDLQEALLSNDRVKVDDLLDEIRGLTPKGEANKDA